MNPETPLQSIHDKVLAGIKSGRVKMRPRWHFILKAALLLAGAGIISLALLYLVSFIIFSMRQTGVWLVPSFGMRGVQEFLVSLPWLLVILTVIFVVILEVLVRRYAFAYRQPLLYSALAIVLLVTAGGFAVAKTSFHGGFLNQAKLHQLPLAEPFYVRFGIMGPDDVQRGNIIELTDNGFTLGNQRDETLNIIITPETRFPLGTNFIEGDPVIVMGEREDDTVKAFGIRKTENFPWEIPPSPLRHSPPREFRYPMMPQ